MTLAQTKVRFNADSKLTVVHWSATMAEANLLMQKNAVRHLPVVDESNMIVGILSDRDVLRSLRTDLEQLRTAHRAVPASDGFVVNYMSRPVVTIDPGQSLKNAAQMMIENNISSLIVAQDGAAVGITTTHDILKAILGEEDGLLSELTEKIKAKIIQSPVGLVMQRLSDIGI